MALGWSPTPRDLGVLICQQLIELFNKCLSSTSYVPGTVLDTGDPTENQKDKNPCTSG